MAIRAGKSGSLEKLKRDLADTGGDKWFYTIKGGTEITVRFLTEPWDFVNYMRHYMDGQSFPCDSDSCRGCDEGNSASKAFVAAVLDVEESRVRAMSMPKSLVDTLTRAAERRGTIMNRDYIIERIGTGKDDTKYNIEPDTPKKRDLSDYELPDIMGMLERQLDEMGDDEDEEEAPRRRTSKKPGRGAVKSKSRRETFYDDDDDDDPGFSASAAKPRRVMKKSSAAKKSLSKKKGLRR